MQSNEDAVLVLDGVHDSLVVPNHRLKVPDGPLTVEGWLCADEFHQRQGFLAKTENGEFGIFVSEGRPQFSIHLDGKYVTVGKDLEPCLEPKTWHHVAGVFDGREVRLYVDGKLIEKKPGQGKRTRLDNPFVIGGDPNSKGKPSSRTDGRIDEVRLSTIARYEGKSFEPKRRFAPDPNTALLLHLDGALGPYVPDSSPHASHARKMGKPGFRVRQKQLGIAGAGRISRVLPPPDLGSGTSSSCRQLDEAGSHPRRRRRGNRSSTWAQEKTWGCPCSRPGLSQLPPMTRNSQSVQGHRPRSSSSTQRMVS